jgi:DNA-binding NarL/FixJ family response regulator
MTHMFFLPNDQTFILLEAASSAEELVDAVRAGLWAPPEPYGSGLAALSDDPPLRAFRQGSLVIITTTQPLHLERGVTANPAPAYDQTYGRHLSPRQQQVLRGLAQGKTTKQIAYELGLRERTVSNHIAALKRRLGTNTRAQTVARASSMGLCDPGKDSL